MFQFPIITGYMTGLMTGHFAPDTAELINRARAPLGHVPVTGREVLQADREILCQAQFELSKPVTSHAPAKAHNRGRADPHRPRKFGDGHAGDLLKMCRHEVCNLLLTRGKGAVQLAQIGDQIHCALCGAVVRCRHLSLRSFNQAILYLRYIFRSNRHRILPLYIHICS